MQLNREGWFAVKCFEVILEKLRIWRTYNGQWNAVPDLGEATERICDCQLHQLVFKRC